MKQLPEVISHRRIKDVRLQTLVKREPAGGCWRDSGGNGEGGRLHNNWLRHRVIAGF